MTAAFRKHSGRERDAMLAWLRERLAVGELAPTDAEIMERFGYASPEQARTLLADLADRGKIAVRHHGAGQRTIMLGPLARPPTARPARAPLPPAVKRRGDGEDDADVAQAVARIRTILGAGKPAGPPASQPPPQPKRRGRKPKPGGPARQINIKLPAEATAQVEALAAKRGVPVSAAVRMIVEIALAERPLVAVPGKPLVRAGVLRAANEAGIDLHRFCSRLLDLGLEAWSEGRR